MAASAVTGIVCGVVISLFRLLVDFLAGQTRSLYSAVSAPQGLAALIAVLSVAGLACGAFVRREPSIASSGIPLVIRVLKGDPAADWKRVLPLKFAACALTLGGGLSMGREGPSVQIGGAVGQAAADLFRCRGERARCLLGAGAAAGLASAFSAPLAGALFAAEVLYRRPSKYAVASCLAAAFAGDAVTAGFFGLEPLFRLKGAVIVPAESYAPFIVLGLLMGLSGAFFSALLRFARRWRERIEDVHRVPWWVWSVVPFAVTGAACFFEPALFGSGQSMVFYAEGTAAAPALGALVALYCAKLALLALCFDSGLLGGCLQPMLGIGALAGNAAAQVAVLTGLLPAELVLPFALAAMAGQFAAAVQAPVTAVVPVVEITQLPALIVPAAIVSAVAFVVAGGIQAEPLYGQAALARG